MSLRWVGTEDVIEKEKKLFSEGASCPSETCPLEAEVAQPAFCPVWKLTCQLVTKDQTWKDPAPSTSRAVHTVRISGYQNRNEKRPGQCGMWAGNGMGL